MNVVWILTMSEEFKVSKDIDYSVCLSESDAKRSAIINLRAKFKNAS